MRDIWVVRHCEPVKGGESVCLGRRLDPPLSSAGLEHARALGERFATVPLDRVYASPLQRSAQTAACIRGGDVQVLPGLVEQDLGAWDGVPWSRIKVEYPELYAARADDNSLVPPDAETCAQAAARYQEALLATQGDCLAVGHKGALSALLCELLGVDPRRLWRLALPHGCCVRLKEDGGALTALPTEEDAERLFDRYGTPEPVRAHCRAVAELAVEMAQDLLRCGVSVSPELVRAAALLHDIARTEKDHPARGAEFLARQGYPHLAAPVAKHHSAGQESAPLDEAAIVFFADKLVAGTQRVSVEERFARSAQSCTTPEARAKHAALRAAAELVAGEVHRATGVRY